MHHRSPHQNTSRTTHQFHTGLRVSRTATSSRNNIRTWPQLFIIIKCNENAIGLDISAPVLTTRPFLPSWYLDAAIFVTSQVQLHIGRKTLIRTAQSVHVHSNAGRRGRKRWRFPRVRIISVTKYFFIFLVCATVKVNVKARI